MSCSGKSHLALALKRLSASGLDNGKGPRGVSRKTQLRRVGCLGKNITIIHRKYQVEYDLVDDIVDAERYPCHLKTR